MAGLWGPDDRHHACPTLKAVENLGLQREKGSSKTMSRPVRLPMTVGLAVALLTGSGTISARGVEGNASAVGQSVGMSHARTTIEQQTRDYLRENPSATLNDDGSIQVAPGFRLSPPKTDAGGNVVLAGSRTDCRYYYLCVWIDAVYQGWRADFYYCGFYPLGPRVWPGSSTNWSYGRGMEDSISSLVNNQTPGTVSVFWDSVFGFGSYFTQVAYGYRDNLGIDGWNDRISSIKVC